MSQYSTINNPKLTALLFAVMVKRLGGKVDITQVDIDQVAYSRLDEEGDEDGSLTFTLVERQKAS